MAGRRAQCARSPTPCPPGWMLEPREMALCVGITRAVTGGAQVVLLRDTPAKGPQRGSKSAHAPLGPRRTRDPGFSSRAARPPGLGAYGRPRGGAAELGSPRGVPNTQKPLRGPSEALLPGLPGKFLPAWGRAGSQGPLECLQTWVGAPPGGSPPPPPAPSARCARALHPRDPPASHPRGPAGHSGRLSLRLPATGAEEEAPLGREKLQGLPTQPGPRHPSCPRTGSSEDAGTPTAMALPTSLCSLASHLYFIPQGPPGTGPGLEPALF